MIGISPTGVEDSEGQKTFLTKERRRWVRINPEQNMGTHGGPK
jgi:hypothetical protein